MLEDSHVTADLTQPAQRNHAQPAVGQRWQRVPLFASASTHRVTVDAVAAAVAKAMLEAMAKAIVLLRRAVHMLVFTVSFRRCRVWSLGRWSHGCQALWSRTFVVNGA